MKNRFSHANLCLRPKVCRFSKHMACETYPFGDIPICYKLNNRIFAQLYPLEHDYKITLKCTAEAGEFYRMAYPGKVVRGYHCPPVQQKFMKRMPCREGSVPDGTGRIADGSSNGEICGMEDYKEK